MCAAIANAGLLLHRCQIGPYNTERLLAFLNDLHQRLIPEQDQDGENLRTFVITWDNVAFHHSQAITTWFEVHPRLVSVFLPPYSPFLNPIEELFSAWRWKVYDHQPHDQMSLLEAMDAGCRDITVHDCQGCIRHTKQFYPRCIALDNIRCDVFFPECSCVFHGYFVHCKQYCKTFSVLSYRVSTVPPVVNSKGK